MQIPFTRLNSLESRPQGRLKCLAHIGPGELSLQTKFNHVRKQETDVFNDSGTQLGVHQFLDAQIGDVWDKFCFWNKFHLTVFGQNLTNERQEISGFLPGLFGTGNVGPDATYGVEVDAAK